MFPGNSLTRPSVHPALPCSGSTLADKSFVQTGSLAQAPAPHLPFTGLRARSLNSPSAIGAHNNAIHRQQLSLSAGLEF